MAYILLLSIGYSLSQRVAVVAWKSGKCGLAVFSGKRIRLDEDSRQYTHMRVYVYVHTPYVSAYSYVHTRIYTPTPTHTCTCARK